MRRFASSTSVAPERSQEEIRRVLRRYGASSFGVMENEETAAVLFQVNRMSVRIEVPLPDVEDDEFTQTPVGRRRATDVARTAWEQAVRQRWRTLLLAIRAKLEAVETGISTLETEFMPFIVMPDGRTIGQHLLPRLAQAAESGRLPTLGLPAPTTRANEG